LLRDSEYKGNLDYIKVATLAEEAKMDDPDGYIREFIELVNTANLLAQVDTFTIENEITE